MEVSGKVSGVEKLKLPLRTATSEPPAPASFPPENTAERTDSGVGDGDKPRSVHGKNK